MLGQIVSYLLTSLANRHVGAALWAAQPRDSHSCISWHVPDEWKACMQISCKVTVNRVRSQPQPDGPIANRCGRPLNVGDAVLYIWFQGHCEALLLPQNFASG